MTFFIRIFLSILLIANLGIASAFAEIAKQESSKTIAILDFANNTGLMSLDHLSKGLSDSLINKLARYQKLNIVERGRLNDAMKELSLSQTALVSSDTAVKLGKFIGSQYIILGSVVKVGELFEVSMRLVEVESSKVVLGKFVRCKNDSAILASIDYLSLEIANSLGEPIDKAVLEQARRDAENFQAVSSNNDLTWLYWVIGGTVVIIGGVIVALAATGNLGGKQETTQSVVIQN